MRGTHFQYDVGAAPQRARVGGDLGAGLPIRIVGERGVDAGAAFDRHPVAELHQLRDRLRGRRDAAFADVNFLRNADLHQNPLRRVVCDVETGPLASSLRWRAMRQHWWMRGLRRKSSSMVSALMLAQSRSPSAPSSNRNVRRLVEKYAVP